MGANWELGCPSGLRRERRGPETPQGGRKFAGPPGNHGAPLGTPGSLRVCHTEFVSRRSSISFLPSSGFSYLDSFRQARGRVKGSFCVFWFLINSLKATPHPGENTVVWGGEISTPTQNTFKGPVQHVTYEVRTGFQQKIFFPAKNWLLCYLCWFYGGCRNNFSSSLIFSQQNTWQLCDAQP